MVGGGATSGSRRSFGETASADDAGEYLQGAVHNAGSEDAGEDLHGAMDKTGSDDEGEDIQGAIGKMDSEVAIGPLERKSTNSSEIPHSEVIIIPS